MNYTEPPCRNGKMRPTGIANIRAAHDLSARSRWLVSPPINSTTRLVNCKQPITVKRIRTAAAAVELRFDEGAYRGKDVPHRFVCLAAGHVRMMAPGNVIYRHARCAQCLHPLRDRGLPLAQALALKAGGRCMATVVNRVSDKVVWECRDGHTWEASLASVAAGHWCPECNKSGLSERQCRTALEQLFGVAFPKAHPEWLRCAAYRRPLELDGYAKSLKIAFEYHGGQHYRLVPRLCETPARLEAIRRKDQLRRELCAANQVLLIEIPEFTTTDLKARAERIRDIAMVALRIAGRDWENSVRKLSIDLAPAFSSTIQHRLDEAALEKGGKRITQSFQGWHHATTWECTSGHRWSASATSILHARTWCPVCAGQAGPSIEILASKAAARGWVLLSTQYINAKEKLRFRCSEGHETCLSSDNFQRGKGCGTCRRLTAGATQRHSLDDAKAGAAHRGGSCLSDVYHNSQRKLRWRCARGHEWKAVWASVRRGTWCGECHRLESAGKPRRRRLLSATEVPHPPEPGHFANRRVCSQHGSAV